jgi:hypothetical protein
MEFFRIAGGEVVTTPVIIGSGDEIRHACGCMHPVWETRSQIPGLVPDGVMQNCSNCIAIRYYFKEFPDGVGIDVLQGTEEDYLNRVAQAQQILLDSFSKVQS